MRVSDLEAEFKDPKAFFWALGSARDTRILYDPNNVLRRILVRWKSAKPSQRLQESILWDAYHNLIEYSGKLRNGWTNHDNYLTRYSARIIAQDAGRAIVSLNELPIVSENYVWHQILNAKRRPRHLRVDYLLAIGLEGTEDTAKVYQAGLRLSQETLRFIKENFEARAKHSRFQALLREPLSSHGL
jgi:hypothetical protein